MKKVFYLKTCDTCKRIMSEFDLTGFDLREIKSNPISVEELEQLRTFTSSYEDLLNKRSQKYKLIKNKNLSEEQLKKEILQEYTYLKRPIFQFTEKVFIGNSKKGIAELKSFVEN